MRLFTGIVLFTTLQAWAQVSPAINQRPTREFGHAKLGITLTAAPNLVEGRELNQPTAIAFDTSSSPPIVYIADVSNHRILGWKNPSSLTDGTHYADKVIGQRDPYSSQANGPGAANLISVGLNTPTAIAVDQFGNLYVADTGNNRILRYPKPFQQQGDLVQPDLVIGQKTFSSGNVANQALGTPSSNSLALSAGGAASLNGMAFDLQGNLWVTDSLNNRVLRYPAGKLQQTTPPVLIDADLVLGQITFDTGAAPTGTEATQTNSRALVNPNSLTFDSLGRLYVADSGARVLYFPSPTSNGTFASRILGIPPAPTQANPTLTYPNQYSLGAINSSGNFTASPRGLFTLGTVLFVCDAAQNRVVRYDVPENWAPETTAAISPAFTAIYGQDNFTSGKPNRGASVPNNSSFAEPTGGAIFNNEMWIVDNDNNRVVGFVPSGAFQYTTASRIVGQLLYDVAAPNLIEGRELFVTSSDFHGSSIVVDRNSTPNHVYVSDSVNNRILGFKDVRTVGVDARSLLTQPADLVIGQVDFFHNVANYPGGDAQLPTATGLRLPTGLSLDPAGNLYVADSGNARILRFPVPFNQGAGATQRANLVLGQSSFTQKVTDVSANTLGAPFGVAVFNNGGLAVSDILHNRVVIYRRGSGDFINGQPAGTVLGQQGFNSILAGSTAATLNNPRGIAVDSGDRLFVADTLNNRMVVYNNTALIANGSSGLVISGFNSPEGIAVSPTSGETWVADTGNGRVVRLKEFAALQLDPANAATATVQPPNVAFSPLAVALDAFDNLLVVEASNRMTFFYAQLFYQNTATYSFGAASPTIAPNTIMALRRLGHGFDFTTATAASNTPYPKTMAGLQLLVNGLQAPIFYVGPYDSSGGAMYFIVPNNAPSSGNVEFVVSRTATGEILGAGYFDMVPAAPGFYTKSQDGTGQVAAVNFDGSVLNGPLDATHAPVERGKIISLYLTGIGHIDNGPPDGEAPNGQFQSSLPLVVYIGGLAVTNIGYSGLSPQFPGEWQLNVTVPDVPPTSKAAVVVTLQDFPSTVGGAPGTTTATSPGADRQLLTGPSTSPASSGNGLVPTIAVK